MAETMKGAASRGIAASKMGAKRRPGAAEATEKLGRTASIPTIPSFARTTRFVTARRARCAPRAFQDRARVTCTRTGHCPPKVGRVGIAEARRRAGYDTKKRRRT